MARGKKKESLTPKERLQAALVPESEQPYPVPGNWCWVNFGHLAIDMADGPFGSNLKSEHYTQEKEVRIIQLSNIGESGWREENTKYTTFLHAKSISRSIVKPGNLVIAKMMPAGRAIICPNNEAEYILSSDVVKFVPYRQLSTKFLLYSINSNYFQRQVQGNTQGITRARTSIKKLKCCSFALPPLPEQIRIVDRIESLFAKLDEAKQKAQDALDSFETRKAAILHKAFTGELTAQWRKEHGVYKDTWGKCILSDIATIVSGYAFSSKDFSIKNTIPCVKITNIGVGEYISGDYEYLPELYLTEYKKFIVNKGDILIALTRSFINAGLKVCIYDEDRPSLLNQRVALIRNCNIKYLYYYLRTDKVLRYVKEMSKTTNQPNLSIKDLNNIDILIPTKDEQNEIVRILDALLAKEQQAKEAAEGVVEQIGLIKKAILARAFRGELGTNDPSEESAVELLKRVL